MERFWSKVQKGQYCWKWQAARSRKGYGRFLFDGRNRHAHIIAYQLTYGPVPEGLCVCHHCDNPPCVRPDHLFIGSGADNTLDHRMKGRGPQKLTPEIVRLIRTTQGTLKEMGKRFNVAPSLIGQIRRREGWKHIK